MTTATAPWMELGGDGKMHEVKDPAKIPAHLLSTEQSASLQREVLRLRQKNSQRKQALRDLNAAMERKSHRFEVQLIDCNVMGDELEEAYAKIRQLRRND